MLVGLQSLMSSPPAAGPVPFGRRPEGAPGVPALPMLAETSRRVVVVDDDDLLRRSMARVLDGMNLTVVVCASGEQALAAVAAAPTALVVSDLQMPGMDGRQLLRRLRAEWPEVGVMMVTGHIDVGSAVACLGDGALDYVTKPIVPDEVRLRVSRAMERQTLLLERAENARRLEERVRDQAERIERLFVGGVGALVEALEAKDPYTQGHSARVGRLAEAIAQTMGLGDVAAATILLGGQLHDIGKIGVRESVLTKPGRLEPEEYQHIMTHPVTGWRILHPLFADQPAVLHIVRWHHERPDGRGVPDGLAGDAIPVEARIVAVADSFDAMTSARPYRPGRSVAEAMSELERCRDAQFDGTVVDAMQELQREGRLESLIGHAPAWASSAPRARVVASGTPAVSLQAVQDVPPASAR